MNGLILIPARKNSRRLKKKNKKIFLGKPLICHTFEFAKKIYPVNKILLSTDDPEILELGYKYNILSPWLRPYKFSRDNSKSIEFTIHAIKWYEKNFGKIDYLVLLQPTSPFRNLKTFKNMFSIFVKNKKVSIAHASKKINLDKKIFYIKNEKILNSGERKFTKMNITGNIYINSKKNLFKYKDFVNKETFFYLTNSERQSIDIDTKKDWNKAKRLI